MVFATVPAAPPTWKNQRATSWPAPISAKTPYRAASTLMRKALSWVLMLFKPMLEGIEMSPMDGI